MATREPIEDQSHETGEENYKLIDRNDNDQQEEDSNQDNQNDVGHLNKLNRLENQVDRNGQTILDHNASMESNITTTSSTSQSRSSSQSGDNSPALTPPHPTSATTILVTNLNFERNQQGADNTESLGTENGDKFKHDKDEDEELEEGELKDDDDDSDDDIPDDNDAKVNNNRFSNFNNDNNDDNGGLSKESTMVDSRMPIDANSQNNPSNYSAPGGPNLGSNNQYRNHRRNISPNSQNQMMMHPQFPPNQHFGGSPADQYRYQEGIAGPLMQGMSPHMNHHPMAGPPSGVFQRGGPGPVGPMPKVNVRCRFYSRTSNKCTWGDHCRFEHRDDSPGPNDPVDERLLGSGMAPGPMRGPPQPPMGAVERPYPPYPGRHQPYPLPPHPYGYSPYEQSSYGPHHSASPPLPSHTMPPQHWRQQHSPYPSSSNHPPESVSPALYPAGATIPPNSSGKPPPNGGPPIQSVPPSGASPNYSSPSSSAVYERKHRLAYESAPWNDRGYPPQVKYDRVDPVSAYPPNSRGGFYRNHYSRDPYGRETFPTHMSGQAHPYPPSGYPQNYPSAYRGNPPGPHASHYRYMGSSQRSVAPDARRSRSNKRGHDEDESSWSDSGSEDSILGQASSSNKSSANKISKKHHQRPAENEGDDDSSSKNPIDQGGSGTPPGEPLPEDRERQEMLLNKLKEIEEIMAKKKGEQKDPM